MNEVAVLEIGREAFFVIMKVVGPLLFIGLTVGITIALFQAITSIQEMTLVFVPKIIAIFIAIIIFLPFMMTTTLEFGRSIFNKITLLN